MDINEHKPGCVLIIRFSAIGDVAMTIPVVYSVAKANPDTRFVFLTRRSMASMMVNRPENLVVEGIDVHAKEYSGLLGLRRLWRQLKEKYPIDAVADLHGVLRSRMIDLWAQLNGAYVSRINKARAHRRALTRKNDKVMLPLPSQRDRYREVFYRLGLTVNKGFTSLFDGVEVTSDAYAPLKTPEKTNRWIGIAPFAAHQGKIYPVELMEQVVKELSEKDVTIFLFGASGEEEKVLDQWAAKYPKVISLAGMKLGFDKELALMRRLDVMISMDSANMHLAAITGTRVITIWGATHPYAGFKAYHQQDPDQIQLSMTCRPCSIFGNKSCSRGDYHCLRGIAPHVIATKALTDKVS